MNRKGFTLVETLIAMAVLGMFFAAITIIIHIVISLVGESKVRAVALTIAQDKIEAIRNLSYSYVGTVGGIPSGNLLPQETVVSGNTFTVETSVVFVDDPFDELTPNDSAPTDYKRARIAISWGGAFPSKSPLVVTTDIAPVGLETDVGGGTLTVQVFDAQGEPVTNSSVHIVAATDPPIDTTLTTDTQGILQIPGTPVCTSCYQITVTKDDYSTDRTYATSEVANPGKPHATILEGQITQLTFLIDRTSALTIKTTRSRESNYTAFSGVQFILTGNKTIGTDAQDNPVYKYQQTHVSGTGGIIVIPNMEWDTYSIQLPGNSSVDFAGSSPFMPFALTPNSSPQVTVVTSAASANSLLIIMTDNANTPLATVSAYLTNGAYEATKSGGLSGKGDYGQAFFSNLTQGSYNLTVTHPELLEATSSVEIIGDIKEQVILFAN